MGRAGLGMGRKQLPMQRRLIVLGCLPGFLPWLVLFVFFRLTKIGRRIVGHVATAGDLLAHDSRQRVRKRPL
ncbi:MAG: hypothetical protein COZ05_19260, partial [Armatimonadetes bacterium CG_4_10_14_3_um_filter_59_10]